MAKEKPKEEGKEALKEENHLVSKVKCDPLVEECETVRSSVLERTEESAILAAGIKRMESAVKELDEAAKIFEDDGGGDAFKDVREDLKEKLDEAKKLKDQCDSDCFDGVKKFNVCKKAEPKPEQKKSEA